MIISPPLPSTNPYDARSDENVECFITDPSTTSAGAEFNQTQPSSSLLSFADFCLDYGYGYRMDNTNMGVVLLAYLII